MERVKLIRKSTGDEGTFGRLEVHGQLFSTGELPWRGNLPDLSCIPAGVYPVMKTFSPHFQRELYEVMNVPRRTSIRIHPANFMGNVEKGLRSDLLGCIALGRTIGQLKGQPAILESRLAVAAFMSELKGQPFELEIQNAFL